MKLSPLSVEELVVIHHTAIRVLIAKGILQKEDILSDLARQGVDGDTVFRIIAALDQIPEK